MRRRSFGRRLLPAMLILGSVLVGIGCGVVNPSLLSSVGINSTASSSSVVTEGNVAIVVLNNTTVATQVNVTVTKQNGGSILLNIPVPANDHTVVVQDCDVDTIQVVNAYYAGTNGGVLIGTVVAPVKMGSTLQCGGGIAVSINGAPPGVFLSAERF